MSGQEDRSSNAAYKLQRNEDTLILIVVGRKLRGEKREETYLPVPVASGGTFQYTKSSIWGIKSVKDTTENV